MHSDHVTIYEPAYRSKHGFFQVWKVMLLNIFNSRFLIQQLFLRDFFAGYKKSFLGIAWIFISPIAGIISWVFLQKAGMLNPGDLEVPYPAYVLMGTIAWELFVGVYGAATRTLSSGKALVMQVKYPHEALFIKELLQFLANFVLKLLVVLVVLILFGVIPKWQIIFLPFVSLPAIFLGSGIGLILSLFAVITGDIMRISGMALKLLMWSTPIIYGKNVANEFVQTLITYNPLTYMICPIRDIILFGKIDGMLEFYYCLGGTFVFLLFAMRLFYLLEENLVEKMI